MSRNKDINELKAITGAKYSVLRTCFKKAKWDYTGAYYAYLKWWRENAPSYLEGLEVWLNEDIDD